METTIYYTFSTIPQVLGGAIALIGVFAIYKISDLKSYLYGISENFNVASINFSGNEVNEFRKFHRGKDYENLLESMHTVNKFISELGSTEANIKRGFLKEFESLYAENYTKVKQIKNITIWTTLYTVAIIIGSIYVLSNTTEYACSGNIEILFRITIFLVAVNLLLMAKIIITSL